MSKQITTAEALELTHAFFEQCPTMPDGWRLDTSWRNLSFYYVFLEGEGREEMRAIINALDVTPEVGDERVTVYTTVKVGRKQVDVRAQMEIEEKPVKIKKSTKARVLAELMGDK